MHNLKHLSSFVDFFALTCGRAFITTQSIEGRCYRTGKHSVCRHVSASLSPEILQAWAVKGLTGRFPNEDRASPAVKGLRLGDNDDWPSASSRFPLSQESPKVLP